MTENKAPDVLTRTVPATSSTSDMPGQGQATIATPPTSSSAATEAAKTAEATAATAAAATAAKATADKASSDKAASDKAASDKAASDKAAADKAAADAEAANKGKTPEQIEAEKTAAADKEKPGIQKRFSELTEERKAAEKKAAEADTARLAAEKKADELTASLAEINKRLDKIIPPDPENVRPDKTKFDDPAKYDEALIAWSARAAEAKARAEAEVDFNKKTADEQKKAADDAAKAESDRIGKVWGARVTEFTKTNPDYKEVAENDSVQISPTMGIAILHSEKGPEIAYHLGKNPEMAAKIATLPPAQQLMEMGKIEFLISQPPKTTTAPDPIVPIKGQETPTAKSKSEMSMDEYAAQHPSKKRA